jgi:hypothetical protein
MTKIHRELRCCAVVAGILALVLGSGARAEPDAISVQVTPRDVAAAANADVVGQGGDPALPIADAIPAAGAAAVAAAETAYRRPAAAQAAPSFYPADLSYFGGHVLTETTFYNIYVNCKDVAACWGNPHAFQVDLFNSSFIHVVDQYVLGSTIASDRFAASPKVIHAAQSLPNPALLVRDIGPIVQATVKRLNLVNPKYRAFFEVFLPAGRDVCADSDPTQCYSPDVPANFTYCSLRASVVFHGSGPGSGRVLYGAMPYQNVASRCRADTYGPTPTPNGLLIDSMDNGIETQLLQAITNPDFDAWYASPKDRISNGNTTNGEVVNACAWRKFPFTIGAHEYQVTLAYSNKYHACVTVQ